MFWFCSKFWNMNVLFTYLIIQSQHHPLHILESHQAKPWYYRSSFCLLRRKVGVMLKPNKLVYHDKINAILHIGYLLFTFISLQLINIIWTEKCISQTEPLFISSKMQKYRMFYALKKIIWKTFLNKLMVLILNCFSKLLIRSSRFTKNEYYIKTSLSSRKSAKSTHDIKLPCASR